MRMNAWQWYLDAWRNFGNFEGRSSRPAFWYFTLVNLIVVFMCLFLDVAIFGEADFPVLSPLYALATFIPGLSLSVRRLHDAGYSGWFLLVGVVPILGGLILLIFLADVSQSGPNPYGPNPESTDTDPMYEFIDEDSTDLTGWQEAAENREEAQALPVKIAVAVAMADGALADSEGETIKRWMIRSIDGYSDEERERLKNLYNEAFKDAYAKAKTGELLLNELYDRLKEIGGRKEKADAVGLCYDVMTADDLATDDPP